MYGPETQIPNRFWPQTQISNMCVSQNKYDVFGPETLIPNRFGPKKQIPNRFGAKQNTKHVWT